ncbi:hypothetical protein ACHAXA_010112 [Cyclostephanos tholiformis]|uniref:[phosphatase 2A protein]-leucine-carboxy methyltransferase n=1 Tax=Cyclostephanos tholiformis TaxID=382380 RepID=A0ABD3RXP6_9STRA
MRRSRRQGPSSEDHHDAVDDAVKSTADDAALAKLSCVDMGYYDDPHLRPMSVGAGGLLRGRGGDGWDRGGGGGGGGGGGFDGDGEIDDDHGPRRRNPRFIDRRLRRNETNTHRRRGGDDPSGTEPMIRRGTHARAMAVERAIDAFLSLDAPSPTINSSSPSCWWEQQQQQRVVEEGRRSRGQYLRRRRQIVILGSGRDTTYLRYRFGRKKIKREGDDDGHGCDDDDVRWFEVDYPSMIERKARIWLPRCVPDGHHHVCVETRHKRDEHGEEGSDGDSSYSIVISPRGASSSSSLSSDYHLVGHDLRSSPEYLFQKLAHPENGYNESSPTLFILECVLMYLPETSARDLLSRIAASPTSSTSTPSFVAVAIYDPIPGHDRFGQLMIENLKRAGIADDGDGHVGDDDHENDNKNRGLLSLEGTRTLTDQLSRLVRTCGFDVAVGCDMIDAYDHGVVHAEDRERAMRCEALDELEEFTLMMRHYCLLMSVATSSIRGASIRLDENDSGGCECASTACDGDGEIDVGIRLCSMGVDSPMGFREGRCIVMTKRSIQ